MTQPDSTEIARRLFSLFEAISPRKKAKSIRLTKEQFNKLAERTKIESVILTPATGVLRRKGIHLIRVGDIYALINETTIESWISADARAVTAAKKTPSPTTLNPQAAWPFPIAAKP